MNKKNLLLIGVLAILIVILLISKGRENTEKRLNAFRFNTSEIMRIEFYVPMSDTLVISRERNEWRVIHPENAPVNQTQLDRFYEHYLGLTTSSIPISEDPARHASFNVDEENATQIVIYGQNDRLLSRVYLGVSSTNRSIAYIRHEDHNQVFSIENITWYINPRLDAWKGEEAVPEFDFEFDENNMEMMLDMDEWI